MSRAAHAVTGSAGFAAGALASVVTAYQMHLTSVSDASDAEIAARERAVSAEVRSAGHTVAYNALMQLSDAHEKRADQCHDGRERLIAAAQEAPAELAAAIAAAVAAATDHHEEPEVFGPQPPPVAALSLHFADEPPAEPAEEVHDDETLDTLEGVDGGDDWPVADGEPG